MGVSISTDGAASALQAARSTLLVGKPLDASDITSFTMAKEEIIKLRELASKFLGTEQEWLQKQKPKRAAVIAKTVEKDFVKQSIPKSDEVTHLIFNSIKSNTLFRACTQDELVDLVDVFRLEEVSIGSVVIKQGDDGDLFFVVESGTLDITVSSNDDSEVHLGITYGRGSSFGELALMYGSPRAATIQAKEDCRLWYIDRNTFRSITGQHKISRAEKQSEFLRNVQIGDKVLRDVLDSSQIDSMALALQKDSFTKGDVIVREGEKGDAFYLIESGSVNVFKATAGNGPVATLQSGQFFGERALLSEDVRQATCIAASDVQCLFLMREDFVMMLGDLQDLLDGNVINDKVQVPEKKSPSPGSTLQTFDVKDLEIKTVLGVGAFGCVKLVKARSSSKISAFMDQDKTVAASNSPSSYALKALSKSSIVDNGLQEHVLNEKSIMGQLNHPFIIKFHSAAQDDKFIYFLLEVLLGGELFKYLRREMQFSEPWARFYSASVLLAFSHIHSLHIAYRDLKPENLVLDSRGYLKLVDFGLAKKVDGGKTWTLCGTPDYLAPEVILNEGHDWAVDYWALGVLIYEMAAGIPPFYADDPMEVYEKILSGHVLIPSNFSRGLSDLLKRLLKTNQSKRLGRTKGGINMIMKHKWFSGFDWDALLNKKMEVPIKPKIKGWDDTSNFDSYPESNEKIVKPCPEWNPDL